MTTQELIYYLKLLMAVLYGVNLILTLIYEFTGYWIPLKIIMYPLHWFILLGWLGGFLVGEYLIIPLGLYVAIIRARSVLNQSTREDPWTIHTILTIIAKILMILALLA